MAAPTTPPPSQTGFASGKDVLKAAKYTSNQFDALYKNMVTTTQGLSAQATAGQSRTLAGMARLSATSQAQASRQIAKSTAQQRNLFGNMSSGIISQNMQGAKVNAKANAIENRGQQAAASTIAAGNTQAFQAYATGDQKALIAAQTGLAEQMKQYNNAVETAQGSAKTVLANSADDGTMVNRIMSEHGKTLDRTTFFNALQQAGYGDGPQGPETMFMWKVYQNMTGSGMSAGDATRAAAHTLYGDQLGKHELNTMTGGVDGSIHSFAVNTASQLVQQGHTDPQEIATYLTKQTGYDNATALAIASQALLAAGQAPADIGVSPGGRPGFEATTSQNSTTVWDPATGQYKVVTTPTTTYARKQPIPWAHSI